MKTLRSTQQNPLSCDWRHFLQLVCLLALCLIAECRPAVGQSYTITDLGTLGGNTSSGYAINASGQVAGSSATATNTFGHAFIISPPYTSMVDLGIGRGDAYSFAAGLNESGQVTGGALSDVVVISPPYTSLTDLGNFGGVFSSTGGYGINASGQITGWSFLSGSSPTDPYHAFIASPPYTNLTDLGTLGGTFSGGYGINKTGQITGSSATADGTARHVFLISPPYTSMVDIGTLGGNIADGFAINDSGQITGESSTPTTTYHAFLVSAPYTSMKDLGTLGGSYSAGKGINNLGYVVGVSYVTGDAAQHAFLYTPANGMVDLNSLLPSGSGWTLIAANAINDAGQITGYGVNPAGAQHAFVLTPPPGGGPENPSQMVADLIASVKALHLRLLGNLLVNELQQVETDIASQNGNACQGLQAFSRQVRLLARVRLITTADASNLLAQVASIESALNCGP